MCSPLIVPKLIQDEFSKLKVSRQRRYQLRQLSISRCPACGEPSDPGYKLCSKHRELQRVRCADRQLRLAREVVDRLYRKFTEVI